MTSKVCPDGHFRNELSKLLALMQMTFKGVPFVYQGQEIGMTNTAFKSPYDFKDVESINYFKEQTAKGMTQQQAYENLLAGSRDNCRTPMCWCAEENAGFTTGTPWIECMPGYEKINVEAQDKDEESVLNFYRKMIALRHEIPTLVYGDFRLAKEKWSDVLAYYRIGEKDTYYVEINLTDKQVKKPVCTNGFELMASNIKANKKDLLVPFEANLYKVR
jgi:oligo-1,6-glucosidase